MKISSDKSLRKRFCSFIFQILKEIIIFISTVRIKLIAVSCESRNFMLSAIIKENTNVTFRWRSHLRNERWEDSTNAPGISRVYTSRDYPEGFLRLWYATHTQALACGKRNMERLIDCCARYNFIRKSKFCCLLECRQGFVETRENRMKQTVDRLIWKP